jgi:membrane protein involved in colicin uptake
MKRAATVIAVLVVLAAVMGGVAVAWNVWWAGNHGVVTTPGAVEQGWQTLGAQLKQSEQSEAEIEKLYWNQPEKLAVLIEAHKQRTAKLEGNKTAGLIVAHDNEAIARLQQRIAAIYAQREAQAEAAAAAEKQAELEAKQQAWEEAHPGQTYPETAAPAHP